MISIAALISGGVDSSVSVHLLCEQGYKPDLFYIKIGMEDKGFTCTQEEDIEMASSIAHKYGLKLDIIDLQKEYWDNVVKYTIDTVANGRTPNPDVFCNKLVKFGAFNDKVGKNYDKIMTGHYATTIEQNGLTWLGTGVDLVKDQTDFLCQIDTWQLNKALFPIGNLPKSEVRRIATENKLVTATRKDSQGICFLGKINYNDFIKKYLGIKEGNIIEYESGKILGKHQGFWFHTIGQRKGLFLSGGPWYVCKKDIENNIVYVTKNPNVDEWILTKQASNTYGTVNINIGKNIHWLTKNPFPSDDNIIWQNGESPIISFKIRHSPEFYLGKICNYEGFWFIKPLEKVNGIAPGQFCVIYNKEHTICYGSGEITL